VASRFPVLRWHAEYTTALHREHGFRATLPSFSATPQMAQVRDE